MNPHWHIVITPKPQFTLAYTLSHIISLVLDKCIKTCICYYNTVQSNCTASEIPYVLPTHPFFCSDPWQLLPCSLSPKVCLFQSIMWLESYIMKSFHVDLFHWYCVFQFLLNLFIAHLFLALNNISLSGWTTVYPFTSGRTSWLLPSLGSYE